MVVIVTIIIPTILTITIATPQPRPPPVIIVMLWVISVLTTLFEATTTALFHYAVADVCFHNY